MSPKPSSASRRNNLIGEALRQIRQARRLRAQDVGAALGIGQRTYEYIETGRSKADFDRLKRFAQATDSDANAIVLAQLINSPDFARRAADNKLATALIIALQEFDQDLGDDIHLLDAASCIAAFNGAFQDLLAEAKRRAAARDRLHRMSIGNPIKD